MSAPFHGTTICRLVASSRRRPASREMCTPFLVMGAFFCTRSESAAQGLFQNFFSHRTTVEMSVNAQSGTARACSAGPLCRSPHVLPRWPQYIAAPHFSHPATRRAAPHAALRRTSRPSARRAPPHVVPRSTSRPAHAVHVTRAAHPAPCSPHPVQPIAPRSCQPIVRHSPPRLPGGSFLLL